MGILLSPEEIRKERGKYTQTLDSPRSISFKGFAKWTAKAQAKKMIERLKSYQTLPDAFDSPEAGGEIFAIDWEDWQALLKEIE